MLVINGQVVINGQGYVRRFDEETSGMVILRHRLEHKWHLPAIWRMCFSILFGRDISSIDLGRSFNLFCLVDDFGAGSEINVLHPEILHVITAMIQSGLKAICQDNSERPISQYETRDSPSATSSTDHLKTTNISSAATGEASIGRHIGYCTKSSG